jgi:hypothetical protein
VLTLGGDTLKDSSPWAFVLTRLHARYDKASLGEDLVFKAARPIEGGREFDREGEGLRQTAVETSYNNFQARYAIRYPWTGPVACSNPLWGQWGGPPSGATQAGTQAARNTAFAKRDETLVAKLAEAAVPAFAIAGKKPLSGVALREKAGAPVKAAEPKKDEAPAPPPAPTKRWWEFWK